MSPPFKTAQLGLTTAAFRLETNRKEIAEHEHARRNLHLAPPLILTSLWFTVSTTLPPKENPKTPAAYERVRPKSNNAELRN